MPDTHLILHVKGTEQDTTSLPKQVVRAAISQGQITHSQLIWSPLHNAWKQVRELPQLWPSQKLAPAPVLRAPTGNLPRIAADSNPQAVGTPKVAARPVVAGTPVARAAGGSTVQVAGVKARPASSGNLVVEEEKSPNLLKWICLGLCGLILVILAFNYLFVSRPLTTRFGQTSFANVSVYSHLGAFMQPSVVVIHIPATSVITEDNITDFLVALAHSTPESPLTGSTFERVALTSGWTGSYSFSGFAWKQLGDMGRDDAGQRKEFILGQIVNAGGGSLVSGNPNLSEDAKQAEREKVWTDLVAEFSRH